MREFLVVMAIVALLAAGINIVLFSQHSTGQVTSKSAAQTAFNFTGLKIVTKIIDGDTVIADGESIRLLGIDADERGYPCYTSAKQRIEQLILGKEVYLEADAEDKDQYERYLRYIFLNDTNVNLQLVQEGFAVARFSPDNTKYKTEILDAEQAARTNSTGCKWNGTNWTK